MTVLQGTGTSLRDYGEATKKLITLETAGGNIADAAAQLAGAATGGRAKVVAFFGDGGVEYSGGLDNKICPESLAKKLCEKFREPADWPELSSCGEIPQIASVGLRSPAFAPIRDNHTLLGALWCEPPARFGDTRSFMAELDAVGTIIAASLAGRRRFVLAGTELTMAHSLLDNMGACMCVMDLQTDEILYINAYMRKEYGITGSVAGKKCWQLFERDKTSRCYFCPAYVLEQSPDEPIVWERLSELNGKYYKNTNSIIRWIDGRPAHLQYSVDISAEKAVQQSFIEAKQVVDVAKRNFLSRLSHEMRTPLNAIVGMARIGTTAPDLNRAQECLQKIASSSNVLHSMINDVLDMSKIESSKMELLNEPFDFEEMLDGIVPSIAEQSGEKRQKLRVRISENIRRNFIGDKARVAQVIANLLLNAVKFTPEGGSIAMEISEKKQLSGSSFIEVKITDTGIGIPKDRMQALFTAFAQIDGGTTRKYGGTGLGLAISKNIANMMNGDIYVESELGKGSTFIFNMELAHGKNLTGGMPQSGTDRQTNKKNHLFAGYSVLIAEDEEINRDVLMMALEDTKLKIECAQNGREAADKFAASPNAYDLILMDVDMPELDGFETARAIRAMSVEHAKKIPIIAMTSNTFDDSAKKCLESGMNDHISKPIDFDAFYKKLHHYLVEYNLQASRTEDAPAAKPEFSDIEGLLDYIDVVDALDRLRGNRKIYKTLLKSFAGNSGIDELKDNIKSRQFSVAAKTAHSIKGASANLSLVAVYRAIVLLEGQFKMDYCDEKDLAAFDAAFEETKKYIDKITTLL